MTTKNKIRSQLRTARQALLPAITDSHSQHICKRIMALPAYQQAKHIACYAAINNEVSLQCLIKDAWQQGKYIYLPVITEQEINGMHFFLYEHENELRLNRHNIKEPFTTDRDPIAPATLDMIIVPLVGFDEHCNRLGQGLGFYDCFLSQYQKEKTVTTIGVAYEIQKVLNLPVHTWDMPLDRVVTEESIYLNPEQDSH